MGFRIVVGLCVLLAGGGGMVTLGAVMLSKIGEQSSRPVDVPDVPAGLSDIAAKVALALLLVGVALGVVVAALAALRMVARRRRVMVRLRLTPYRADEAVPDDVRRLFDTWHQVLIERWWRRPFVGQAAICLEVAMCADGQGGHEVALTVACPESRARAVEGALRSCYPDVRIAEAERLPDAAEVIRLKKRAAFLKPLSAPAEYDRLVTDSLLNQMVVLGEEAVIQFALTPTPALFDRWAYARLAARERSGRSERGRSELLSTEVTAGLSVRDRPLFFTEIRVGGAVVRQRAGDRRLAARRDRRPRTGWSSGTHAAGRAARCTWTASSRALGNPIPGWHRGVVSTGAGRALAVPQPGPDRGPAPALVDPASRRPAADLARAEARGGARRARARRHQAAGQERRARPDRRPEDRQDVARCPHRARSMQPTRTAR